MNSIGSFIERFQKTSKTQNITEVFTCGCCYWFAHILCSRFPDAILLYDPVMNHFLVGYNDRLYDITGDVTEQYDAIPWEDFEDELERQRIVDYCIEFNK